MTRALQIHISMTRNHRVAAHGLPTFSFKSLDVRVDLIVVCLWAITGLIVTALVTTFDAGADIAGILVAAE